MVNRLKELIFKLVMNILVLLVIVPLFEIVILADKARFNIKKKYYDTRKIRYVVYTGTFGPYLIKY